jgi:hypothetical protein
MSDNNKALDLFAGADGTTHGLRQTGFHVVGVDIWLATRIGLGRGVASVGSDRGPGDGAGRRPVPGRLVGRSPAPNTDLRGRGQ